MTVTLQLHDSFSVWVLVRYIFIAFLLRNESNFSLLLKFTVCFTTFRFSGLDQMSYLKLYLASWQAYRLQEQVDKLQPWNPIPIRSYKLVSGQRRCGRNGSIKYCLASNNQLCAHFTSPLNEPLSPWLRLLSPSLSVNQSHKLIIFQWMLLYPRKELS